MDESLSKITINIYTTDLIKLRSRYGYGWSERLREMIHEKLKERKTIGDLDAQ